MGVSWHKGSKKWNSQIYVDGARVYLGMYHDKIDAAKAYNEAAKIHHGEFSKLNKIEAI